MDEDFPRSLPALEARFTTEAACLECLATLRWPDGVHVPTVRRGPGVAHRARAVALLAVPDVDVAESRDALPPHPPAPAPVVSGDLAHHESEVRGQRAGPLSAPLKQ